MVLQVRAILDAAGGREVKVIPCDDGMLYEPMSRAVSLAEPDWEQPRAEGWTRGGAWGSQRTILFSGMKYAPPMSRKSLFFAQQSRHTPHLSCAAAQSNGSSTIPVVISFVCRVVLCGTRHVVLRICCRAGILLAGHTTFLHRPDPSTYDESSCVKPIPYWAGSANGRSSQPAALKSTHEVHAVDTGLPRGCGRHLMVGVHGACSAVRAAAAGWRHRRRWWSW